MDHSSVACGCLLAGAIGDALGYSVEFLKYKDILKKYPMGIQEFELTKGVACISDDTQMILYTAEALLHNQGEIMDTFYEHYLDWAWTQLLCINSKVSLIHPSVSKLAYVEEMRASRAPGNTCINSLLSGKMGTLDCPINHSKGCGGLMRIAPIALFYGHQHELSIIEISKIAASNASITHGHELGYIPAFCLANIITRLIREDNRILEEVIKEAIIDTEHYFKESQFIRLFVEIMNKAIHYSKFTTDPDFIYIKLIGEGWVAEETLAISIYCALKYQDDFLQAIIASVNHNGDSDSTGSVTGNILGAYLGIEKIPSSWINQLELNDLIYDLSSQLVGDSKPSFYQFL